MRAICYSALLAALLLPANQVNAQGSAVEIRVLSPGVISNAGLPDLAAAFTKETGTKVTIVGSGMGRIVNDAKTITPPLDVLMLPLELMSTLSLDGGKQALAGKSKASPIRRRSIRPGRLPADRLPEGALAVLSCRGEAEVAAGGGAGVSSLRRAILF
jgi:hypothetical protein